MEEDFGCGTWGCSGGGLVVPLGHEAYSRTKASWLTGSCRKFDS